MPIYHIHVHDGVRSTRDEAGHEFENDAGARREAIRALCDIATDEVPRNGDRKDISVHVTDDDGQPLFSARIDFHVDAVARHPPGDEAG